MKTWAWFRNQLQIPEMNIKHENREVTMNKARLDNHISENQTLLRVQIKTRQKTNHCVITNQQCPISSYIEMQS